MHEYVFDVKFYASISIKARNLRTAESVLRKLVDVAELDLREADIRCRAKVQSAGIFVDDEEFPFLAEYDGEDPLDGDHNIV